MKSLLALLALAFLVMGSAESQAATVSKFKGTYSGTFTAKGPGGVVQVWILTFKVDANASIASGTAKFGKTTLSVMGAFASTNNGMMTLVSRRTSNLGYFVFGAGGVGHSTVNSTGTLLWNFSNQQPAPSALPKTQSGSMTIKKISNS